MSNSDEKRALRVERVFPIRIHPKRKGGLESSARAVSGLLWQLANESKQLLPQSI
jgi:hypothetical protein